MFDFSIDTSDPTDQGGPVTGPNATGPNAIRRKQMLADALLKQGMDTSPAAGGQYGGWLTAANRALAGALGGYRSEQLDNEERAGLNRSSQNFASGFANTPSPPTDTPAPRSCRERKQNRGLPLIRHPRFTATVNRARWIRHRVKISKIYK
jgi:hypothetical protein